MAERGGSAAYPGHRVPRSSLITVIIRSEGRRVNFRSGCTGTAFPWRSLGFTASNMITQTTTLTTMPAHARVWVYKSARPFSPEEQRLIGDRGAAFTATWAAHGAPLDATVEVLHDHFVVIAVDEQQARASGCSIDKSVQFIQQLERDLQRTLTDRMVVVYEVDGQVRTCRVDDIEDLLDAGELQAGTIVFDDLVGSKGDLDTRFRIPLKDSWMERFL
jgi:hypothetical protein